MTNEADPRVWRRSNLVGKASDLRSRGPCLEKKICFMLSLLKMSTGHKLRLKDSTGFDKSPHLTYCFSVLQIYITTKKYPFFALLNFLCVIAQMSKLVYVKSVGENLYIFLVLDKFQAIAICLTFRHLQQSCHKFKPRHIP